MLKRVNCALRVGSVVGAYAYRVKLLIIDKLFVVVVTMNVFHAVVFEKFLRFAVNEVSTADNFNVGHFFELLNVRLCNPACADNTHFEFFRCVNIAFFLVFLEHIENVLICH